MLGIHQRTYLYLTIWMMERRFLLDVHFFLYSSFSRSTEVSNIYDLTLSSSSSSSYKLADYSVESQYTSVKKELGWEGGITVVL